MFTPQVISSSTCSPTHSYTPPLLWPLEPNQLELITNKLSAPLKHKDSGVHIDFFDLFKDITGIYLEQIHTFFSHLSNEIHLEIVSIEAFSKIERKLKELGITFSSQYDLYYKENSMFFLLSGSNYNLNIRFARDIAPEALCHHNLKIPLSSWIDDRSHPLSFTEDPEPHVTNIVYETIHLNPDHPHALLPYLLALTKEGLLPDSVDEKTLFLKEKQSIDLYGASMVRALKATLKTHSLRFAFYFNLWRLEKNNGLEKLCPHFDAIVRSRLFLSSTCEKKGAFYRLKLPEEGFVFLTDLPHKDIAEAIASGCIPNEMVAKAIANTEIAPRLWKECFARAKKEDTTLLKALSPFISSDPLLFYDALFFDKTLFKTLLPFAPKKPDALFFERVHQPSFEVRYKLLMHVDRQEGWEKAFKALALDLFKKTGPKDLEKLKEDVQKEPCTHALIYNLCLDKIKTEEDFLALYLKNLKCIASFNRKELAFTLKNELTILERLQIIHKFRSTLSMHARQLFLQSNKLILEDEEEIVLFEKALKESFDPDLINATIESKNSRFDLALFLSLSHAPEKADYFSHYKHFYALVDKTKKEVVEALPRFIESYLKSVKKEEIDKDFVIAGILEGLKQKYWKNQSVFRSFYTRFSADTMNGSLDFLEKLNLPLGSEITEEMIATINFEEIPLRFLQAHFNIVKEAFAQRLITLEDLLPRSYHYLERAYTKTSDFSSLISELENLESVVFKFGIKNCPQDMRWIISHMMTLHTYLLTKSAQNILEKGGKGAEQYIDKAQELINKHYDWFDSSVILIALQNIATVSVRFMHKSPRHLTFFTRLIIIFKGINPPLSLQTRHMLTLFLLNEYRRTKDKTFLRNAHQMFRQDITDPIPLAKSEIVIPNMVTLATHLIYELVTIGEEITTYNVLLGALIGFEKKRLPEKIPSVNVRENYRRAFSCHGSGPEDYRLSEPNLFIAEHVSIESVMELVIDNIISSVKKHKKDVFRIEAEGLLEALTKHDFLFFCSKEAIQKLQESLA